MLRINSVLDQMIRVNHAGEYGAVCIYHGQELVFRKKLIGEKILEMKRQEQKHFSYFDSIMREKKIRPTAFIPIWHVMGVMLGVTTAMLGEGAAMACTVAVEDVISEHYQDQISILDDSELRRKIVQFRDEELEHHNIAACHNSANGKDYKVLSYLIKKTCKIAIAVSKVI
ncbi:demethoxyubiquinone hydroxylase family protein [Ehrlichia ruminantium]|uniref:Demethoxyubiquinone hydroxylase family protein n=1 Tax=Ehrlichia ruminantium TaxID=779 RepID=A0AAE6Q8U6_EHRRU|nr:demethoxyubiquinone hydroxylase family protein [Ehrlichia ruminantium]QGR02306.1 demethoxyubiquinone hydroxylase family protein [Ehrlichia ruminantium]QGR03226.1 demethoxyubiquinone hydroxylase family protein [Ehrlichia ruminantium]QGR04151.1 demethoxyubiquinone hydroxylase family protein [Ehrlichia ruminantium]